MTIPRLVQAQSWLVLGILLVSSVVASALLVGSGINAPSSTGSHLSAQSGTVLGPRSGSSNLVVDGTTVYLHPNSVNRTGVPFYDIGGNVTVENGGWLYIDNLVLDFESFTATHCQCASDLLNRFNFSVTSGGHVVLSNSTVTTNPFVGQPYLKLNLTIRYHSSFTADNDSSLAFPGSIVVENSSSFFLNRSQITSNLMLPQAAGLFPQNFTLDNSYAASVLVTGKSSFESLGGYINNTYKNDLAGGAQENESFASLCSGVAISGSGATYNTTSCGKGSALVPSTYLTLDTYDQWSSASINLLYSNLVTSPGWVNATLNINESGAHYSSVPQELYLPPASHGVVTDVLPPSFVTGAVDSLDNVGSLSNLLTLMDRNGVSISLAGGALSNDNLLINQTWLTLTPWFQYNMVLSDQSTFIGVNSEINVNWLDVNNLPSPAYASNKFILQDGSTAYLVNSTANSYETDEIGNESAFQPDATSNVYVMQWVKAVVETPSGGPVQGATLNATPVDTLASNPNNLTGNHLANGTWLAANLPALWQALDWFALDVEQAPGYAESNATGVAYVAVATNDLFGPKLPDGSLFGEYNVGVWEAATNVSNVAIKVYAHGGSPPLCGWPYQPSPACFRPALLPTVTMPVLAADIQLVGFQLNEADATARAPLSYFENFTVSANVTIRDVNAYPIVTSGLPLYVFDSYPFPVPGEVSYNQSHELVPSLTDGDFSSGLTITEIISWTLPYDSAGPHLACAEVDPYHTNPWPTADNKVRCLSFQSEGVPFWNENAGSPTKGSVSTSMLDAATGVVVGPEQENTQNSIYLTADIQNIGDTEATPGSVTASFQLCYTNAVAQYVCAWTAAPISNSAPITAGGTWDAKSALTYVVCTCVTTVQVLVNYTLANRGLNSPSPFGFWAWETSQAYSVPTIDYTSITLGNVTQEAMQTNGALVAANGTTVHVGQLLAFNFTLRNTGGLGTNAFFWLGLWETVSGRQQFVPVTGNSGFLGCSQLVDQSIPGCNIEPKTTYHVQLDWHVDPNVIQQNTGVREFGIFVGWSNGALNRTYQYLTNITIAPSLLRFTGISHFTSVTSGEGPWPVLGNVVFNDTSSGVQPRTPITLSVYFNDPLSGANESSNNATTVADGTPNNGSFTIEFSAVGLGLAPGTYNLVVQADVNGASYWFTLVGTYSVAGPSSCSGFFCGYLWIILVVVVVAVVAVILAVFFMSKSGKGRLVECGECGELIPDTATSCPKCNAEFEQEMVRCSRCASTIPTKSNICPECSALLLGKEGTAGPEEQQRKDFAQTIERFRAEGRKELGENYTEGSFWDWWKRQPTYLSYSAFKLQAAQGTRAGMSAPGANVGAVDMGGAPPQGPMGPGGGMPPMGGGPSGAPPPTGGAGPRGGAQARGPAPPAGGASSAPMGGAGAAPAAGGAAPGMKVCSNCGREINADFFVCPFCSTATQ